MGMFQKAANAYVQASSQTKNAKEEQSFIYNAAILYDALNAADLASKYYAQYLPKASAQEKADILFKLGELNYRNQRWTKSIESFQEYIRFGKEPEFIIEAYYKVSVAYTRLRKRTDADEWKQKVVSVQRRLVPKLRGPGAQYAARIRLDLIEPSYSRLISLRFSTNTEAIKRTLAEKLDLLENINKELSEVIKYDSPEEIVGALELLGRANENMYNSYMSAPLPAKVAANEEAKVKYLKIVEEQALPFKTTALESYRKAVARGRELEAYPSSYFDAIKKLRTMDPQTKSEHEQQSGSGVYLDWMGLK
jgi:tetratricopeptide (TPR) repeat protein